jgi:cellulose biosynthesis protein BcsQ
MQEVARRLNYHVRFLRKHFPQLCCALSARYVAYRKTSRIVNVESSCREVRAVALKLHTQGIEPTRSSISKYLSKPAYFRDREVSAGLADYPLPHDLIIFDCPATLGPLPLIAVCASTHLMVPIQVEPKSTDGAGKLLEWFYHTFRRLRLKPEPQIAGIIPNQYDQRLAIHRNILCQLEPQLSKLNIKCFKPIRFSSEFKNASALGLPLHLHRPKHPACAEFDPIVTLLSEVLEKDAG